MARKDAIKSKAIRATMRQVLASAKSLERFTSDPDVDVYLRAGDETLGGEFWKALAALAEEIVHLPRAGRTLQARLARAEAETVRGACESCESIRDQVSQNEGAGANQLRAAIIQLDIALVRLAVMAR